MSDAAPTGPGRVHVRAPGKLNVFFSVGDVQEDGYHNVASVYQAVSLYEDVVATVADEISVTVTAASPEIDTSGVPWDRTNLAFCAAELLQKESGYRGGVRLEITKGVPVAGGMGGGSADAAAALLACNVLWGLGYSTAQLQEFGAELGADVPFSLLGGTAVGTGRGDRLAPALAHGSFDWVLVTDEEGISTPLAYRELDRSRSGLDITPVWDDPTVHPAVLHALRVGDAAALAAVLHNDLEPIAVSIMPSLRDTLSEGADAGAIAGLVSGSGPTVAFLAESADHAATLCDALVRRGYTALVVHGPVEGARVIS